MPTEYAHRLARSNVENSNSLVPGSCTHLRGVFQQNGILHGLCVAWDYALADPRLNVPNTRGFISGAREQAPVTHIAQAENGVRVTLKSAQDHTSFQIPETHCLIHSAAAETTVAKLDHIDWRGKQNQVT